jgi:sarcosine oxidase subunit beta
MPRSSDVVVIGAGIIGCAAAYFLTAEGHRVTVVERGDVASGTASASGGWVIIHDKETSAEVALALESRRLYDRLASDAGVEVHRSGGMILATTSDELARLRGQADVAISGGVSVELLTAHAVRDLEPELAPDIIGATYCADEGTVYAPQACEVLIRAVRARGGEVLTDSPVTTVTVEGGKVVGVGTTTERIAAPVVVCACGVWSPAIGELVGVRIPVAPRRGHLLIMETSPLRRPVLEAGYLDVSGSAQPEAHGVRAIVQPRGDGTCVVGSSREFKGMDNTVDPVLVERIRQRAARFVPALAAKRPARVTVGFRPYTPLGRPIVGWAGPEGFLVTTGHEGQGVTLAPITGKLVSDLIAGRIRQTGLELSA